MDERSFGDHSIHIKDDRRESGRSGVQGIFIIDIQSHIVPSSGLPFAPVGASATGSPVTVLGGVLLSQPEFFDVRARSCGWMLESRA
jgi:hypothetical protein